MLHPLDQLDNQSHLCYSTCRCHCLSRSYLLDHHRHCLRIRLDLLGMRLRYRLHRHHQYLSQVRHKFRPHQRHQDSQLH